MRISEVLESAEAGRLSPLQRRVLDHLESHDDEVFSYRDELLARAIKSKVSAVGFTLWALHQKGLIGSTKVGRKVYFGSHHAIGELNKQMRAPAEDDWLERARLNREAILRRYGYIDVLALLDEVREGR
jgi:hypothetical protein